MQRWMDGCCSEYDVPIINRQYLMKNRQRQGDSCDSQLDLFSLQKNLLQVWQSLNVDQYYQNLILSHLDSLPGHQAKSAIAREIKETHEGSSQYFKLAERLRNRKKELATLSSLVGGQASTEELEEITQLLGELRDHNLAVAEMLIGMHRQYAGSEAGVSDECMQMLQCLDSDNDFLKESFLSQFILFQQGYDPFFLYHYDMRAKKSAPQTHPLIDQLFNLSISYACRLFKAKTKVLELLTQGKFSEAKNFKRARSFGRRNKAESATTIDQPQQDTKRGTSSNFRVRGVFSLEKAKERERMQTIDIGYKESPIRQPLISREKMEQLAQDQPEDSDEEEEAYKLVPVRYKIKKGLPRSPFLYKQSLPVQEEIEPQMKYSLNFKEKLQPIPFKQPEEPDRSSVFKRSTIKNSLLKPISPLLRTPQESPLASKHTRSPPQDNLKSSNGSQGKDIKMRPGKVTMAELPKYLKQLDLSPELKTDTISNVRFEESLSKCQAYVSELLIGGEMKAVGVCFTLPDGDCLVKLWAPLRSCNEETSRLLLRKYLEYLQRQTGCGCLYYGGSSKSLFLSLDFMAKSDKLFFRKRTQPLPTRNLEFPQFLAFKCSTILFPQDNQAFSMLYSDEIECFSPTNHYVLGAFAEAERQGLPGGVQMAARVSQGIADMRALNSLLQDEGFDTYEVTSSMKITNISAIRLAATINLRSPFLAGEGCFRLSGQEMMRRGESLVVRVQGVQLGATMLLGKGLPSVSAFVQAVRQAARDKEKRRPCEFSVKMFSKQLYGRIPGVSGERCSYGNWEFSLSWKDELHGRVRHNLSGIESFGPSPFFFGLELEQQLVFCFEVTSEDFLF